MWFLTFQALGEQPEVLGVEMVETLLAKALPALARKVWGASKELADAPAASAEELQSKFTLQPDVFGRTFHMAYGDQQQFNQGLNGLIGPPTLPLLEAMEAEVRARRMACSVKRDHWPPFPGAISAVPSPARPPTSSSSLRVQHCSSKDSRWPFTTANYGVTTTSEVEWIFVVSPENEKLSELCIDGQAI